MHNLTRAVLFVSVLTALSFGVFAFAAGIDTVNGSDIGIANGTTKCQLGAYIMTFINIGLALVGVVAVIFIIYAGVKMIISQGDEKEMQTAKMTIVYAVIGLIIIGLAAVLVNTVLQGINGGVRVC